DLPAALCAVGDASAVGAPTLWDDLHRLQQAGFLRLWLYPEGRPTRPVLQQALHLPARQYFGSEGYLAAERGPGLELLTLGPHREGESAYFALLNRGLSVVAVAEPTDVEEEVRTVERTAAPTAPAQTGSIAATYQALPADLYTAPVSPHTLVRMGGRTPLTGRPKLKEVLAWLQAGEAQVAYGPVIDWKLREFAAPVGYATQPVPAADRIYHLDLSLFIGPGAAPEAASLQRVELLRNGVVVAQMPIDHAMQTVRDLTFEIHETASCWYMLRAWSGPAADNTADLTPVPANWRPTWSAPIHFAAATELTATPGPRSLPVRIRAFRALDGAPLEAEAVVTRGGFLISKTRLAAAGGAVAARVGDHILVGGPGWQWRETVVSPWENRSGDPWRDFGALPQPRLSTGPTGPDDPPESAAAADARLSGLGLLCPLTPRQSTAGTINPADAHSDHSAHSGGPGGPGGLGGP
ncbi:MAG: hypothetical protein ACREJ2_06655, partial [Planctomycetota bacterium]